MIRVSSLKKNPKNPRQIKGEKLELLKKSVASFQKMMALRPMIVDENNIVLGGNMRLAAIKALGLKEIPDDWVKRADDLSEDEKAEFVIKDNNSFGEYDWDAIANEWDAFPLSDWGLDVPGFETVEEVGEADAEPQIDKAAELNKKWKVKSGDLWQIGEHRLLCGDNIHGNKGLTADLCLTDPPYNIGLEYATYDDTKSGDEFAGQAFLWFQAMQSVTANLIVTPGRQNTHLWMGFDKCEIAAWVKSNAHGGASIAHFAKFEPILFYGKHLRKRDCDVFEHHVDNGFLNDDKAVGHPCAKPLRLWNDLIENYTEHGQTVYEPFAGSGTTLVACQNLNRKCYAIEISENYCAVILERMATAFPEIEIKRIEQATAAKT
jgi:DNA modification methylase